MSKTFICQIWVRTCQRRNTPMVKRASLPVETAKAWLKYPFSGVLKNVLHRKMRSTIMHQDEEVASSHEYRCLSTKANN